MSNFVQFSYLGAAADNDTTFKDIRGVTHEALRDVHPNVGDVSLCGLLREPMLVGKNRVTLHVFARPSPPEGVDCMTCLVQRTKLGGAFIELELTVKSWS